MRKQEIIYYKKGGGEVDGMRNGMGMRMNGRQLFVQCHDFFFGYI